MLLKKLIETGISALSGLYPEKEAGEMVYAYMEHLLGVKRYTHVIYPEYCVSEENAEKAISSFRRMSAGEPLQYVMGKSCFYGRDFLVTPDVLIPRSETELLCREVIRHFSSISEKPLRILDLCTGSGCIAWTLALELPGAEVIAADISEKALEVASSQDFHEEILHCGSSSPSFVEADVLSVDPALLPAGKFDVIVSNPPYVRNSEKSQMRENVLGYEPHIALFVTDEDPLVFYRAVAEWAVRVLAPGGFGIVEINEALGKDTAEVFRAAGFSPVSILQDFSSKDRFVTFHRADLV
ncbi:MAG: peptide chain release factor N(5)-glutamine methyltransferase [Bacteroidales bacterium]|nr:peptide chain release factor N(5)-glutamine methyltransferase [Bacteroidales bacterium]